MLEERIAPLIQKLKTAKSLKAKNDLVTEWFSQRTDNLANSVRDLAYLIDLPREDRKLISDPIIANWYVAKLDAFKPQNIEQKNMKQMIQEAILQDRFSEYLYESRPKIQAPANTKHTSTVDKLTSLMNQHPLDSQAVRTHFNAIGKEIEKKSADYNDKDRAIQVQHGLMGPVMKFNYILVAANNIASQVKEGKRKDFVIMVVDDEMPRHWYRRLCSVGFIQRPTQRGFFYNCEDALKHLKRGDYDVVLSDLELGEGKMHGREFAHIAYEIQKEKGKIPLVSVFSTDKKQLEHIDRNGEFDPQARRNKLYGCLSVENYKPRFMAGRFFDITMQEYESRNRKFA